MFHRDLQRSWTVTTSFESVTDLIPRSEPVKSESELDKAEETTSYNKWEVNLNIQSTAIDVNALGAAAKPNIAPKADPDDDDETELTGEGSTLPRSCSPAPLRWA